MGIWTTTDLLAEVRRLAMLPASSTTVSTDADILAALDGEIQTRMVPLLMRVNEEHLVRTLTVPIASGKSEYVLQPRAIGGRLRSVDVVIGSSRIHVPRLKPEDRERFGATTGAPAGFMVDAGQVTLYPTPNFGGTLETAVYVRPSRLVATSSARAITTLSNDADYLGSTSPGRTRLQWTGSVDFGGRVDISASYSPSLLVAVDEWYNSAGGATTSIDVPASGTLGPGYAGQSRATIGDWVSAGGTSPVAQIPTELQTVLCQRVASRMLRTLGYLTEARAADDTAKEMEAAAILVLSPRTDGNPKRLSSGVLGLIGRGAAGPWR